MKVFYVPFNNRGLGVEAYEETGFMQDLVDQATKSHIEDGEDGVIFIYASEPDSGFIKLFSQNPWPKWLKGINMVIRRQFDIEAGDKLAVELAGDANDVITFVPYPSGLLTEEEIESNHRKLLQKWGWGYIAPVEKVASDTQ